MDRPERRFVCDNKLVLPAADPVKDPSQVWAMFRKLASDDPREHFCTVLLDARYRSFRSEIIAIGTANASLVHPREVFRPAIRCARPPCVALVVAHTHPSGDPTPSHDDWAITRRLREAGDLLGIAVLDHVVVTTSRWVSMRELERWK